MKTQAFARTIALSCCALVIALCTACGGGGDTGSSANSASSANTTPPVTPNSGIDSAGGTVTEASGAKVVIPAGALSKSVAIAVTQSAAGAPALPGDVTDLGVMYAFTPHGTTFDVPATITVPFDPAALPAGKTPVLLKTNATQSAWEVVSGATVNGNTMVGNVSGFSFATVVSQVTPVKIEWSIEGFTKGDKRLRLEPKNPKGPKDPPDPCTGCTFDIFNLVGDPQAFMPSGLHFALDDPTYWIFSFDEGRSFGSMSLAPHAKTVAASSPVGVHNTLKETFTFIVDEDKPSLQFLITILHLEGVDDSGFAPNRQACPEMSKVPAPGELEN